LPSDNAARSKHLLLKDFEPGRVTVPSRLLIGVTVRELVSSSTTGAAILRAVEKEDSRMKDNLLVCVSLTRLKDFPDCGAAAKNNTASAVAEVLMFVDKMAEA
jgi:hypothetical protein